MLFKDIKEGYPVFIFDRSSVKAVQGKVVNKGFPHMDSHYGSPTDMVVDVTIESEGNTTTYTFKDSTEVGYSGNLVIATDRSSVLHEAEAMKAQAEQALTQVETHKANIQKCEAILAEFNPTFKEKRETEERFCKLEDSIGDLKTMISGLIKELKG